MISREEAHKSIDTNFFGKEGTVNWIHRNVDKIYDSITKCGECKLSENIMLGELKYAKCSLFPSEGNVDIFELDEFCSKGEPR